MPITQDRFLGVIDAAAPVITLVRYLRNISRQNQEIIISANSVIDHLEDTNAKRIVQELLGQVNMINAAIVDSDEVISVLEVQVGIEQKYFKRVGNSNKRAAYYQRQKRILTRDGHGEVYETLGRQREEDRVARAKSHRSAQSTNARSPKETNFENDPNFLAAQETSRKIWEKNNPDKAAPQMASPTNKKAAFVPAGASYDRGVLSTSTPSSEELAKPDLEPGQDIF